MMYLYGLISVLLVLTAEARIGNSTDSLFCTETKECLLFDLICKTDNYEVRRYDAAKWVTTEETSLFMEFASMRAFKRLFKYITGANEGEKTVEMTAPVLMEIQDVEKRFWEPNYYTMSFLLPSEHQKTPPGPTDSEVKIREIPGMMVYVRSYGGWMMSMSDKKEAKTLSHALDSVGAKYKKGFHYAAGYNSPMVLFNRHNEVWYIVEDEPACPSSEELD